MAFVIDVFACRIWELTDEQLNLNELTARCVGAGLICYAARALRKLDRQQRKVPK